eukprot:TRINITY_DN9825_c0_g2_i1.p1 TRINITY_DN9825_c0_g2~~TRINITY_DN9825_c0_g2_i1.p1  ORF type:complete len:357 (+),score=67.49 TRINITY_DN9825_c0_g2_i1:118-1071(+)
MKENSDNLSAKEQDEISLSEDENIVFNEEDDVHSEESDNDEALTDDEEDVTENDQEEQFQGRFSTEDRIPGTSLSYQDLFLLILGCILSHSIDYTTTNAILAIIVLISHSTSKPAIKRIKAYLLRILNHSATDNEIVVLCPVCGIVWKDDHSAKPICQACKISSGKRIFIFKGVLRPKLGSICKRARAKYIFPDLSKELQHLFDQNHSSTIFALPSLQPNGIHDIYLSCNEKPTLYFNFHIDGASPSIHRKFTSWVIWLSCTNLPPQERGKYKNMILAGIACGTTKPDMHSFLSEFVTRMQPYQIKGHSVMIRGFDG